MRRLSETEAKVCFKLYRQGCFGSHWLQVDTATSGFPSHELDQVKQAIDVLLRDGILGSKQNKHGKGIYIRADLRDEVYQRVREHPGMKWLPK